MLAKEILEKLQLLDREINLQLKQLGKLRNLSTSLSATGYEESYNPNKPTDAPFVRSIEKIVELEEKITASIDNYVDYKEQILELLRRMENFSEREVLELHYIHYMTWDAIAMERVYSERWVYKLRDRALESFDEVLSEEGITDINICGS